MAARAVSQRHLSKLGLRSLHRTECRHGQRFYSAVRLRHFVDRPEIRQDTARLLRRRLWWEFLSRFAPGRLDTPRRVRLKSDVVMEIRLSEPVDRSIYLYGTYEYRTVSAFLALIGPSMAVVDAGAHHGLYTLLAARRVGRRGRVLAVEPDPDARARLLANVALNAFKNVEVIGSALSDRSGVALLHVPADPAFRGRASLRAGWNDGQRNDSTLVTTECLDTLLDRLEERRLDVIKLDVEGWEPKVLSGSVQTIARDRPAIIFEVNDLRRHNGEIHAPAMTLLRDWGYKIYGIALGQRGRCSLEPLELGQDPDIYREPWLPLNLVAVHASRSQVSTAEGPQV